MEVSITNRFHESVTERNVHAISHVIAAMFIIGVVSPARFYIAFPLLTEIILTGNSPSPAVIQQP
jgi:hypothetical protein